MRDSASSSRSNRMMDQRLLEPRDRTVRRSRAHARDRRKSAPCRAGTAAAHNPETSRNAASAVRRNSTAAASRSHRRRACAMASLISCREFRAHALVGIERQHPVALRERQREILLRAEILRSRACDDARALCLRRCCAVSSLEPLSTTMRSSQNARLSRQAAILLASFLVITMAESLGIARHRRCRAGCGRASGA